MQLNRSKWLKKIKEIEKMKRTWLLIPACLIAACLMLSACSGVPSVKPTDKKQTDAITDAGTEAAKKTEGVKDVVVNFMTLKMKVEFDEGADVDTVMKNVRAACKKVEDDCEVYI